MRTCAFVGMFLLGLALVGVGGCSGFSNGDEESESGISAFGGTGGSSYGGGGDGSGTLEDGDILLRWWWTASWDDGACMHLMLYNHTESSVEWSEIYVGMDREFEKDFQWFSAGFPDMNGSELSIYPTAGSYHLSKYGTQEFDMCAEPALTPVAFAINAHSTSSGGWDGWGDDDDLGDDDDDDECDDWWNDCGDDDDDCDQLLFGQLEDGNIRLAYMDAGYETNCGRCIRLQLYSTGTDDTYCNLEATITATVGFDLTYAESLAWDHDPNSNVITVSGMWDDDLDEWDAWEGRICVNPVNSGTAFDFYNLEIDATQGVPNECP